MPIGRDFPDAVSMPDGSLRIVTRAARVWIYQNTKAKQHCATAVDLPQFVLPGAAGLLDMMRLDGLVIRTKKSSLIKSISQVGRDPLY